MRVTVSSMLWAAIRRYKKMILASIFFFYLGCGLTLNLLNPDCAVGSQRVEAGGVGQVGARTEGVEYVVLVPSGPTKERERDTVRVTWGNLAGNIAADTNSDPQRLHPPYVKILFSIGTLGLNKSVSRRLKAEGRRSGDLLLLQDFEDRYDRLAGKMLASLMLLNENFPQLKYVIKCDDDSFVRIDLIVEELKTNGHNVNVSQMRNQSNIGDKERGYRGLYWGYFDGRARVQLAGQWAEPRWFLCDNYLPYALGGGYVLSRSIVSYLAANADMLSHYNSEDVAMGVWTGPLRGINRVHDVRFDTQWRSRGCRADLLVRHKLTPNDMRKMYARLAETRGKTPCQKETVVRHAYMYNWDALPSNCCSNFIGKPSKVNSKGVFLKKPLN